jgi:succinoglycan biosynthesis transport protein ExoP
MSMNGNGNSLVPATVSGGPPPLPDSSPPIDPVASSARAADAQPTPLKKVHQLLRGRYHWVILLSLVLGSAGAVGGFFIKKPVFESVGVIRILPTIDALLYPVDKTPAYFPEYVAAEMQAMTSERVVLRALQYDDMKAFNFDSATPVINELVEGLTVRQQRVQMVRVGYEDEVPMRARAVVRSIVGAYMELYGEREQKQRDETLRLLQDRRVRLTSELNALRDRHMAIVNESGGLNINDDFQIKQKELFDTQAQIRQIETELAERGVDADAVGQPKAFGEMTLQEMSDRDKGVLGVLLQRRQEMEMVYERLLANYGANHRLARDQRLAIDLISNQIEERRKQLIAGAASNNVVNNDPFSPFQAFNLKFRSTDELTRLIQTLKAREETVRADLMVISQRKNQLDLLYEEIDTTKRRLGEVRLRITQLEFEQGAGRERIQVLQAGTTPTDPSNGGKRKQLAALGGMAGASLGVTIMLLIGLSDPRLRTIDDARTGLYQSRMLGILPSLPEDLADPQQASIAAHCVHHIRTMLQVGVSPDQHRVYSVTSPGAGTGKTSLTLALGLSFAASESRTLLIDCDLVGGGLTRRVAAVVRRRIGHLLQKHGLVTPKQIEEALHVAQERQIRLGEALIELGYIQAEALDRVLNLQEQSLLGVMDACNGEPFDHCIAETGVKNLSILPTGTAMARHAASLSPGAVNRLVAHARSKFDIVLIDTGPILGSLEASVVAGTVDGTVLIVSRGDHRAVCDKSVEYLQSIRANLLGIVFNRAEVHDFERSSFTSLASLTSLRPNDGEVVEGEIIDGEASSRLGPVGSAVAVNSRIARNGSNRHS